MKKFNFKKTFFTFIILAALSPIAFTYQNFSRLDIEKDSTSFNADLSTALQASEDEQRQQKLAASVDPLPKAKKKIKRKPAAIYDGNTLSDSQETIVSESTLAE